MGAILSPSLSHGISTKNETLQNAVTATGNGTASRIQANTTAVVQVSGTFVGTVAFEASLDGTNYVAIQCFSISDRTSTVTTVTTTGAWRCNVTGLTRFRARVSSYTSGSITVRASYLSAGVF